MKGGRREEGGSWGCACGCVGGRGGAGACCPSGRVDGSSFFFLFDAFSTHCRFSGALPHAARPLLPGPPAPRARARRPALPPPRLARLGITGYRCARPRPGGVPIGVARDQSNTHAPPTHTKNARCLPPSPSLPPTSSSSRASRPPPAHAHAQAAPAAGGGFLLGSNPVDKGDNWVHVRHDQTHPADRKKKAKGLHAGECREGATRARQACHRPPARPGPWGARWAMPWPWKLGVDGALVAAARRRGGSRLFLDTPAPVYRVPARGPPALFHSEFLPSSLSHPPRQDAPPPAPASRHPPTAAPGGGGGGMDAEVSWRRARGRAIGKGRRHCARAVTRTRSSVSAPALPAAAAAAAAANDSLN